MPTVPLRTEPFVRRLPLAVTEKVHSEPPSALRGRCCSESADTAREITFGVWAAGKSRGSSVGVGIGNDASTCGNREANVRLATVPRPSSVSPDILLSAGRSPRMKCPAADGRLPRRPAE